MLVSSTAIEDVVVTGVRSGISSSGPGSTITADDIALTASIDKGIGDFLKEIQDLQSKVLLEMFKFLR